jgi:hypothetical protein
MARGGVRPGAGRKGLSSIEKLRIGDECARRWAELTEQQTFDRHEKSDEARMIRLEQVRAHLIPVKLRQLPRRETRENLEDISISIDEITGGKRFTLIPTKRPYGSKTKLLQEVVDWFSETYNLRISISQARESWKAYRQLEKDEETR